MKATTWQSAGRRLKSLFCLGLSAALAAGIALNSAATGAAPVHYDVKVVSSSSHTAALSGSDVYFWGTNSKGQLPGLSAAYTEAPVKLVSGAADVSVSRNRTLVVSKTGELRSYGVEPATGAASAKQGTVVARDAAQAAAGSVFAAYVSKDGALYTWGQNTAGQLGSGDTRDSAKPVQVFAKGVKKVSLGDAFALALMEDGAVYGWGANSDQQLGSETEEALVLQPIQITTGAADIATGRFHSCILKNNGTLWTCGSTSMDQTGVDVQAESHGLQEILAGVRSVSSGSYHNFAVTNDGTVYAWGFGLFGQLGSGKTVRYPLPTETAFDFVQIFASEDSTFAVSPDGSIYSFGDNVNYVLGKSDGSESLEPMRILDKDMNWVFDEIYETAEIPHNADGEDDSAEDETGEEAHDHSHDGEEAEAAEEEYPGNEPAPEIVSTPFISGDGEGHFLPEKDVTRAEFLRMVVSALCKDFDPAKDYGTPSFSDIQLGRWYENYVAFAEQQEIITGDGSGKFRPGDPITKAEVAVIVSKAMKLDVDSYVASKFQDVETDRYFTKPIDALSAFGILNGDGSGNFYPQKDVTRAEAATIIAQAAGYQPDAEAKAEVKKAFAGKTEFTDIDDTAWYYPYLLRGVGYVK